MSKMTIEDSVQKHFLDRITSYVAEYATKAGIPDVEKRMSELSKLNFVYKNKFIAELKDFYKQANESNATHYDALEKAVYQNCLGTVAVNLNKNKINVCLDETNPTLYSTISTCSHEILHDLITTSVNLYHSLDQQKKGQYDGFEKIHEKAMLSMDAWQFLDEGLQEWISNEIEERFKKENDCSKYKQATLDAFEELDAEYQPYAKTYFDSLKNDLEFRTAEDTKIETYTRGFAVCQRIAEKYGKEVVPYAIVNILNWFSIFNSVDDQIATELSNTRDYSKRRAFRMKKRFETQPVKVALELCEADVPKDYERNNLKQFKDILCKRLSA